MCEAFRAGLDFSFFLRTQFGRLFGFFFVRVIELFVVTHLFQQGFAKKWEQFCESPIKTYMLDDLRRGVNDKKDFVE